FFGAPARTTALAAFERAHGALLGAQSRKTEVSRRPSQPGTLDLSRYQGRRWITRQNLFIDRLASIWLIQRFIDTRPRFAFVSDDETVKGGIAFDMFGAEFTHQGEDCTFETMLKRFGLLTDAALREIAEIVHDIDLKDDKFGRLETQGMATIVRGLAELL